MVQKFQETIIKQHSKHKQKVFTISKEMMVLFSAMFFNHPYEIIYKIALSRADAVPGNE